MEYISPSFKSDSFHCPNCNVYSHISWHQLIANQITIFFYQAKCVHCNRTSIWKVTESKNSPRGNTIHTKGEMIFPDRGIAPFPEIDMPNDVKKDYEEAAKVFSKSPRSAAALLRLGLQKLCKHLGEDGENINNDIRNLAKNNTIPPKVIKVADTVRITGNNAVHPGEMSDEDIDHVASKMFALLNFIVKKGISEPKELEDLYNRTPEAPRLAAETKDAKAREKPVEK